MPAVCRHTLRPLRCVGGCTNNSYVQELSVFTRILPSLSAAAQQNTVLRCRTLMWVSSWLRRSSTGWIFVLEDGGWSRRCTIVCCCYLTSTGCPSTHHIIHTHIR